MQKKDLALLMPALEARHLRSLTFPEVRRALEAVSALYVEKRDKLATGKVFDGTGKRAAFALFYGPLHYLVVEHVVQQLQAQTPPPTTIVEPGCGTAVGAAAWANLCAPTPHVIASDIQSWAASEAKFTLSVFGIEAQTRALDILRADLGGPGSAVLLAYVVNELDDRTRASLLERLLQAKERGARILVIEAIRKTDKPWWPEWAQAFTSRGGRDDEWTFRPALPELLRRFDQATKLRHDTMKARSLYLA